MPDERDPRSPLWNIGALGTVGAGFAYGMKGNWRDMYSAAKGLTDVGPGVVSDITQSAIRYNPLAYSSTMEALGSVAIDPALSSQFGEQISTFAYESLTGAKIPTGHPEARDAMRRILEFSRTSGQDPMAIYRFAGSEVEKLSGDMGSFNRRVNRVVADPALLSETMSRFKGVRAATEKMGVQQIISHAQLTAPERRELEHVMGRLRGPGIDVGKLIEVGAGDVDLRLTRVGKENVAMARIGVRGAGPIELPLSTGRTPVMYRGEGLTRYITRGAWDIEGVGAGRAIKTKSFNEYYLDELAKSLTTGRRDTAGIKEALHATNRRFSWGMLDEAGEALSRAAVRTPAPEMMGAGGLMREQMLGQQLVYAGENITPELLEEAIEISARERRPLTPFLGAGGVGKGTLMAGDVRQQYYGPLGELFPAQKAPFQFVREEWGLTEEAVQAATRQPGYRFRGTFGEHTERLMETAGMGPEYERLTGAATRGRAGQVYATPKMTTLYTTDRRDMTRLMSAEEGWIRRSAGELQEYERIRGVKMRVGADMPGHRALVQAMKATPGAIGEYVPLAEAVALERGELIGIEIKTHRRALAGAGPGMEQELIGFRRTRQGEVIAALRETQRATPGLPRKFFGPGDVKHLMHDVADTEFSRRLTQDIGFTAAQQRLAGQQIEQVLAGERLAKNPYALARQQISAMDMLVSSRIDRAGRAEARALRQAADPFFKDPTAFLSDVFANQNIKSQAELEYQVQRRIVRQAQEFGLTQGTAGGLIFGMTREEHMKRMYQEGLIRKAEVRAWSGAEGVIGISTPYMGDLVYEGGTGKMGKMDVAGFRLLSQKGYAGAGDLGAAAAVDIAERTLTPRAYAEISRMHGSIIGARAEGLVGLGAGAAADLAATTGTLARQEGQLYNLGAAAREAGLPKQMYIPGVAAAEQLGPILTGEGELLESELHRRAAGLRSAIQSGDAEAMKAAHKRLAQASQKEFARSAVMQGKVVGSRILTGTQQTAAQAAALGEGAIGISGPAGARMFEEMIERAPETRRGFLRTQKEAFLAGEAVAGMAWRHPNVGPESIQLAKYKLLEGAQDAMIYMPRARTDIMVGGELIKGADVSPLVGFKGDFDKDQFVLSAIGREDVNKRASRALAGDATTKYNQYLGRHYAMERMIKRNLEAQGTGPEIMRGIEALKEQARAHGYAKMATGQTNIALQQAKIAIAAAAPGQYDELATAMWHLEETAAIGSKHGLDIGGGELYKRLGSAIRDKNQTEMSNVLRSVFGEKQQMTSIVRGAEAAVQYDPDVYAQRIIGAVKQMPDEVSEAVRLSSLATKGESRAAAQAMIDQYLMVQQGGSPDVAGMLAGGMEGKPSLMGRVKAGAWQFRRRARAVGQVLSRAKTPLALGAAAAGAVALAAPSISGHLTNPNLQGAAGGKNVDMSDSIPVSGPEMTPPKQGIMRSPRVYDTGNMASRVQTRYNANDIENDRATIMRQVAAMRGNGANVRMQLKDDRAALDPHMLANKIHERM